MRGGAAALCCAALLDSCATVSVAGETARAKDRVVAKVNGEAVLADEVERELKAAYGADLKLEQVAAEKWQQAAEQVVCRRLVLEYLNESKQGASEQDVAFALEQLRNELKAQGMTLTEYFRRGGWQEDSFRRHLAWTLGWQRFLERTLTEANLQKYFQSHLPDFDGREVRVAHLLLKAKGDDADEQSRLTTEARRIRTEMEGGRLTFAEAVKRYSQAPTADHSAGDLGFIRRHEPMPEAFAKAALWLDEGEVSQPVATPLGVHLIQCLEIRPGKLTWRDVEGDLRKAVALYLFNWAAEKQKAKATIEWVPLAKSGEAGGQQ